MNDQTMMLGVPAGAEPVSERSLEEKPVAPAAEKKKRTRNVRGIVKAEVDNEMYRVEMRQEGVTVRRSGRHHTDTKPMREIVDFVTGQGRLEFRESSATRTEPEYLQLKEDAAEGLDLSPGNAAAKWAVRTIDSLDKTIATITQGSFDASATMAEENRLLREQLSELKRSVMADVNIQLIEQASQARASGAILLECCIEFIAAHTMQLNEPKYRGRYELAASALRSQVEVLAPGAVEKVIKGL